MSIQTLAADLASRIPEMSKDSPINNSSVIEGMIEAEISSHHRRLIQDYKNLMNTHWHERKQLKEAIKIAQTHLKAVRDFDDRSSPWDDPGYCAIDGLKKIEEATKDLL